MATNRVLPRVVALGTYDKGKPRTRILLRGLKENGVKVTECHIDVWSAIEDKSQVQGVKAKLAIVCRLISAYPVLIWRYSRQPKHDVVLIGYLGLFDVLILWPFVRMRGAVLVWDVFLSLYNTVVEDRALIGRNNPASVALWLMEWLALRLVDMALMDTQAHVDYLCKTYHCSPDKVKRVFVGVEPEKFDLVEQGIKASVLDSEPKQILFYGQFIPLHGIETVVRAAKLTESENVQWLMIGKGQESSKIRALVEELKPVNISWLEWVEYDELIKYLANSHVALGIFGSTDKAQRVIPNKVFQILMAGRPLITADTPAVRELLCDGEGVQLIPTASPDALASAVITFLTCRQSTGVSSQSVAVRKQILPASIGFELLNLIKQGLLAKKYT
ncbi:MAG: hypothetical protein DRR42_27945 [Gammaproteobacteria bacterium]|nr:MAG: hypothetical protein DRR42_27945 [Gammaproteobacteria bacterium]